MTSLSAKTVQVEETGTERGAAAGDEVLMSGGVALNGAMVAALREALGRPVRVLPEPQLVGALGAALSVVPAAYLFA